MKFEGIFGHKYSFILNACYSYQLYLFFYSKSRSTYLFFCNFSLATIAFDPNLTYVVFVTKESRNNVELKQITCLYTQQCIIFKTNYLNIRNT